MIEPPLKWAGGKRWQLPVLRQVWAKHAQRRLVEPFCGGLSVSLGLEPKLALLNDANEHLTTFYTCCALGLEFDLDLNPEDYYANREWFNALIASGEDATPTAAWLFYYLNRFGFNGLCRYNADGKFNVPDGKRSDVAPPDIPALQRAFEHWMFTHGDFERVLVHPDDFLYADPPYDSGFTSYTAGQFSWDDQVRLVTWLAKHSGPVIATNHATDRIKALYTKHGFNMITLQAPRRIGGTRERVDEMLAANFDLSDVKIEVSP